MQVQVIIKSARDLKNVNWRYGMPHPYAVVWIDTTAKYSTKVDQDNGSNPVWNEKFTIPFPPTSRPEIAILYIDVVHAHAAEGIKPLIGSSRFPLRVALAEAQINGTAQRSLNLERPSGRPQGTIEIQIKVTDPLNNNNRDPYKQQGSSNRYTPTQSQPQPQIQPPQFQARPQIQPQPRSQLPHFQPDPQIQPSQFQPQPQIQPQLQSQLPQFQPQPQIQPSQFQDQPQIQPPQFQPPLQILPQPHSQLPQFQPNHVSHLPQHQPQLQLRPQFSPQFKSRPQFQLPQPKLQHQAHPQHQPQLQLQSRPRPQPQPQPQVYSQPQSQLRPQPPPINHQKNQNVVRPSAYPRGSPQVLRPMPLQGPQNGIRMPTSRPDNRPIMRAPAQQNFQPGFETVSTAKENSTQLQESQVEKDANNISPSATTEERNNEQINDNNTHYASDTVNNEANDKIYLAESYENTESIDVGYEESGHGNYYDANNATMVSENDYYETNDEVTGDDNCYENGVYDDNYEETIDTDIYESI